MAHLREKNGNFYAEFYDKNRRPKRKWVALRKRNIDDARDFMHKLERRQAAEEYDPWIDEPIPPNGLTVAKALEEFLASKRNKNTRRSYKQVIELFANEKGVNELREATPKKIESFLMLRRGTTANNYYRHLHAFFNWCIKRKYLNNHPMETVPVPDKGETMPKVIYPDEVDLVCLQAYKLGNVRDDDHIWACAPIKFAFYSGFRLSEICRLKWRHIDFDMKTIYIEEQKNHDAEYAPLTEPAEQILLELPRDDAYVFPAPRAGGMLDPETLSKKFCELRRAAELPEELSFHSLRHGFCTYLAEQGLPALVIKEAARHKSITTTMIYIDLHKERLRKVLNHAWSRLKSGPTAEDRPPPSED